MVHKGREVNDVFRAEGVSASAFVTLSEKSTVIATVPTLAGLSSGPNRDSEVQEIFLYCLPWRRVPWFTGSAVFPKPDGLFSSSPCPVVCRHV